MTEKQEKITLDKNLQEQEERKAKYEADKAQWKEEKLALENLVGKKDDEIFELQKANEKLAEEGEDWKKEAHRNHRAHQAEKKTKEESDFMTELAKLQAKKGININE